MRLWSQGIIGVSALGGIAVATPAAAANLVVPDQVATIQEAIDVAASGDVIHVRPGEYCGATIEKQVTLVGHGQPVIVGCVSPDLGGNRRIGFFLPGSQGESSASGTRIYGFSFDGRNVSNSNLAPLSLGIFARFADDVHIVGNRFFGTVQAITNTGGDSWNVAFNRIEQLTLFDCAGFCAGGAGIVFQTAVGSLAAPGGVEDLENRPENNWVVANRIEGALPDAFDAFGMVGILLLAADATLVKHNDVRIPDNPLADAPGQGILVTNTCCGDTTPYLPGSRASKLLFNDGRGSETGIVVDGANGDNTEGLLLFGNRGTTVVEGVELQNRRSGRWRRLWSRLRTFR